MKKVDLLNNHLELIDYAVKQGLGQSEWVLKNKLSGGLTDASVYQIIVCEMNYVVKLENPCDKIFDLVRNYKIVQAVSKQGISPKVYFTDSNKGIILMQYIAAQRTETTPAQIKKFAQLVKKLHDTNSFSPWKSVIEIIEHYCQGFSVEYMQHSLIKESLEKVRYFEKNLFDPKDARACHCDLNPANVLYNDENYFFIDWQAASPQSLYFDLACCANWLYFYNEEFCNLLLEFYFDRKPSEEEKYKYALMRVFVAVYYGIGFLALSQKNNARLPVLTNKQIDELPAFPAFMMSIGAGQVDLNNGENQQKFGFIFLKTAYKSLANF